jgi:serine/threonine-protein kinase
MAQACRGLQAAHDRGLVHRDIKPSNIFVLEDDSVKLIDFGVAHLVGNRTAGMKGTLSYMSPEQIGMDPLSASSDIFSLAVVCYEALTRQRPFRGSTEDEVAQAILHHSPPPSSDLNPAVSPALSQVVHAAMAKKPWHRTSNAKQFAEELQRALRRQPIERFESTRIEPRIARVQKALEESEYEFAGEIISELEAEGHLHPELRSLRQQIDRAVREKRLRQLLESARRRMQDEEYPFALQKIEELLRLDPGNPEAVALKATIETKHRSQQVDSWVHVALQHIANHAYNHARDALQNVLQVKPTETRALQLMGEVNSREQEYLITKKEKEELFELAMDCYRRGEVSQALTKLERVLELDQRAPDNMASEKTGSYQSFYNQVRSENDAIKNSYAQARKLLEDADFAGALALCEEYQKKYPGHALFRALRFDIGERARQQTSAYIAEVDRNVDGEPDLDRRVAILEEALRRYPDETHFQQALKVIGERRDLVNSIVQKARNLEDRGQYAESLNQWEILRTIYAQYPGLDFECERVSRRRDQQSRSEAKAKTVEEIDRALSAGDFARGLRLAQAASAEFPADEELVALEQHAQEGLDREAKAAEAFERGQELCATGQFEFGLTALRQAVELASHNQLIRMALIDNLLKHSTSTMESDAAASERSIRQALELDPANSQAKGLLGMLADRERQQVIDQCLARSRQQQTAGNIKAAFTEVEQMLRAYPQDTRLQSRKASLEKLLGESDRAELKAQVTAARATRVPGPSTTIATPASPADAGDLNATRLFKEVAETQAPSSKPGSANPVSFQSETVAAPREQTAPQTAQTVRTAQTAQTAQAPAEASPKKSGSLALVGVAAALIAIIGVGGWWFLRGTPESPQPADIANKGTDVTPPAPTSNSPDPISTPSNPTAPGNTTPPEVRPPGGLASPGDAKKLGWLEINVTPPQSQITYVRKGETQGVAAKNGDRINLPEGQYTVTASADKSVTRSESVTISADKPSVLNWSLSPQPVSSSSVVIRFGMEGLDGSFVAQDGWQNLKKGTFALAKFSVVGDFFFDVKPKKFFWISNYVDDRNYVQFQIDEKAVTPTVVENGKTTVGTSLPIQLVKRDGNYTITVHVTANALFFYNLQGGQQVQFYNWPSPDGRLLERKSGFRDEVSLKNFHFEGSQQAAR